MSTAPRDATPILAWDDDVGLRMVCWLFDEWAEPDGRPPIGVLIAWMPYPKAPKWHGSTSEKVR